MHNEFGPVARAAVSKAELGLVLPEVTEDEIMARAYTMRAETHAQMWRGLARAIRRLFGGARAETGGLRPLALTIPVRQPETTAVLMGLIGIR